MKFSSQMVLKKTKVNFFTIFCMIIHHKGLLSLKKPFKIIFTFCLRNLNIPSAHQSSTLYMKLSHMDWCLQQKYTVMELRL